MALNPIGSTPFIPQINHGKSSNGGGQASSVFKAGASSGAKPVSSSRFNLIGANTSTDGASGSAIHPVGANAGDAGDSALQSLPDRLSKNNNVFIPTSNGGLQFIHTKDDKMVVIKKAPPIENLALSGGGGKGLAYPGVFEAMEKNGVLQGVKRISGTSAGALTAALLAGGFSAHELKEAVNSIDFWEKLTKYDPDVPVETSQWRGLFGGAGFYSTVNSLLKNQIQGFLSEPLQNPKGILSEQETNRLKEIANPSASKDSVITFNDLAILRKIDPRFKELNIVGWDDTARQIKHFNNDTAPNTPIAQAARISMSLPVILKPVYLDAPDGKHRYYDGGLAENKPVEWQNPGAGSGPNTDSTDKGYEKSILLAFDEDGSAYETMHRYQEINKGNDNQFGLKDWFTGQILAPPGISKKDYYRNVISDNTRTYNMGHQTLPVFHPGLGTLSFRASEEEKINAQKAAYEEAVKWLNQRESQGIYKTYSDPESLVKDLSEKEREAIVENGTPPDPSRFDDQMEFKWHQRIFNKAEELQRPRS